MLVWQVLDGQEAEKVQREADQQKAVEEKGLFRGVLVGSISC